jgi:hypothetical protein
MVEDLGGPLAEGAVECLDSGDIVFCAAGDGLVDEEGSV